VAALLHYVRDLVVSDSVGLLPRLWLLLQLLLEQQILEGIV
jgi:hypothetical protein